MPLAASAPPRAPPAAWAVVLSALVALAAAYAALRLGQRAFLGVPGGVGVGASLAAAALATAAAGAVLCGLAQRSALLRLPWRSLLGGTLGALLLLEVALVQPAARRHDAMADRILSHHQQAAELARAAALPADSHLRVQWNGDDGPDSRLRQEWGGHAAPPRRLGYALPSQTSLCVRGHDNEDGGDPLLLTLDHYPPTLLPDSPLAGEAGDAPNRADMLVLYSPQFQFGAIDYWLGLIARQPLFAHPLAWFGRRQWVTGAPAVVPELWSKRLPDAGSARANVLWTEESGRNNIYEQHPGFMDTVHMLVTTNPMRGPGRLFSSWGFNILQQRLRHPLPPLSGRMTVNSTPRMTLNSTPHKPFTQASPALVVWTASHCSARSRRLEYLQALGKVVPVHSLGNCWRTPPAEHAGPSRLGSFAGILSQPQHALAEQWAWMGRRYKFWFAAENYLCDEYMTEKFWLPLAYGAVPIIYGSAHTHRRFAPARDAYLDVRDFASPAALGRHLLALDADDAAYQRLHAWRTRPLQDLNPAFVGLLRRNRATMAVASANVSSAEAARLLGRPPAETAFLQPPRTSWLCAAAFRLRDSMRQGKPLPSVPPLDSCDDPEGLDISI